MEFFRPKVLVLILLVVGLLPFAGSGQAVGFTLPKKTSRQTLIKPGQFYRTELFFGRNKPDGNEVSETEFNEFLNETITPEFPEGLTILDGIGQFREASGKIIQEKAKVLVLIYSSKMRRQNNRKIERIRNAYKKRFQQESVLRVESVLPVKVSF